MLKAEKAADPESNTPAPPALLQPSAFSLQPLIRFRPYQLPEFEDRSTGIKIYVWSRQIGKSFTLAAWAVDRLLTRPGRLVTILSNSRDNGAELNAKCADICRLLGASFEQVDLSPDVQWENMNMETRITVAGRTGRIKVLAANPRTARGFSGDLILDEFAFHENSDAIWEAAEPILSANPDYLCRISSTYNGRFNMFYRMATSGLYPVVIIPRSLAWQQGLKIYHPVTRAEIAPDQARALALNKRAYDQNYECVPADENMALLTFDLISAAERALIPIDEQAWTAATLQRLFRCQGSLDIGCDIGRNRDLTVITALETLGPLRRVAGMLRMQNMRLPDQQRQLDPIARLPRFRRFVGDMTGLGLGLIEYFQDAHPGLKHRIHGLNFASTEPLTEDLLLDGRRGATARVTEIMATRMLRIFEDRAIEIPTDAELRDDLRKPERITTPGGKVSIAATRDEAGHADHFWSLALAIRASDMSGGPAAFVNLAAESFHSISQRRRLL